MTWSCPPCCQLIMDSIIEFNFLVTDPGSKKQCGNLCIKRPVEDGYYMWSYSSYHGCNTTMLKNASSVCMRVRAMFEMLEMDEDPYDAVQIRSTTFPSVTVSLTKGIALETIMRMVSLVVTDWSEDNDRSKFHTVCDHKSICHCYEGEEADCNSFCE